MREIVLDTETTGLDPLSGHRVVEIGAVELVDHAPPGRTFPRYVCPERAVPADAVAVHGLTVGQSDSRTASNLSSGWLCPIW